MGSEMFIFFFQAEDGIRDAQESRGLGDVYKRQVGGGAKNKEWKQIQADIFNCPVKSLQAEEGPATGAAMIAAVGLNWYANFEDCAQYFVKYTDLVYPIKNNVQIYNEYYEVYKDIYNQTKGLSSKIYHIQKK